MSNPCYYHPDAQARSSCVQCGLPICDSCTDRINEKTVCHKCVKAVRQRMEAQMASSPVGAASAGPTPAGYAPGGYGTQAAGGVWPPTPAAQFYGGSSVALAEPLNATKIIIGIVFAALIGLVGAIIVEKIEFATHVTLSLLYILVGYGIGFGICKGAGRGGLGMATVAVTVMIVCVAVGQLVYAQDALNQLRASGENVTGISAAQVLPGIFSQMGFIGWLCIAIGLYSCFKGVARQG